MSNRHGVQVTGEGSNVRPFLAICTCGWISKPRIGQGAHFGTVCAKWQHIDDFKDRVAT